MLHTSLVAHRAAAEATGAPVSYRHQEKIRLYRCLLKGAHGFPMRSRRDVITEEVRSTFRDPNNELLSEKDIDYRLILGWERAKSIKTYAENMHWFHSRDEVTKEMMYFSEERDRKKAEEMRRFNQVGDIRRKTEEVTEFKSTYYNVHPDYHSKIGQKPLTHSRDVWRARGQYGSDVGGPRQKFFVRRFKAMFPQGCVQAVSYTSAAVARHTTFSGSLTMSFGAAGVELVGAVPVTDGVRAHATIAASTRRHVHLADCDASTTDGVGGDAGGAGGYSVRQKPPSHSVMSESVVAGTSIARDSHTCSRDIGTRAGSAAATTMAKAVERCLTAAQNGERDEEGRSNSCSPRGDFLVTPTGAAAAKAREHPVTVITPQARPTSSTSLASSPRLAKMESSSRSLDRLPQQRQRPISPGSPSSHTLSSTAVPVQHLYRVPSAFYAHNSVTSSAVLSAARNRRGHGDTFTGPAAPRISAEDTTHKQVRLPPEASRSPSSMDALEERARRAAELHASCGIREEAEAVLPWATASRSGEAGRTQVPVPSSLRTVQVARGYRASRHLSTLGAEEGPPLDVGDVELVPGSRRRRRTGRMGSSADVRFDQRLSYTSSHDGSGGAAVSRRCLTSSSASSLSSVALASPQSPATALVSATAPASGISGTRPSAASSPFNALLAAFAPVPSGIAELTAAVIGPPLATATVPPTRPPAWLRPWLSHALSRAMAAHLERDADTVTTPASSAATSTQGLDSFFPVAHAASASAQPCTLRSALLLIFDGLERLEADLAEVLLDGARAHHSSNLFHSADDRDCRASFAFIPPPPAAAAASGAFDRLVEQLRHLTRQWCEVLSQWPCEAATLGYVAWWMGHPAWTDLVTCDAAISTTFSTSPATPAAMDRREMAGRRTETGHGGERQPPQQQPQEPAYVLQGILAAVVTEGMRTLLDALVDAFVRAVSELLRSTAVIGQPRSASRSTSCPDLQAEVAVDAFTKPQHTCLALLRLLTSLYVSPPPVLQQLRTLVQADVCCGTAVTSAAANGDGKRTTRHEDEGSPASPGSLSTATAAAVAGEDRQNQSHPHPHPSPSSLSTPRGGPPGSPSASRVNLSALDTSQLRSPVCQLHYQLLYAVCRLCNELPMLWQPQDDTRDADKDEESNGVRASSVTDYMDLSSRLRDHGECEMAKLTLFSTAARLAATVSALLLHVQLPMKGDLLCVASRLAQWRAKLLRSSCMSEREYAAAMGHLCALMAQAT